MSSKSAPDSCPKIPVVVMLRVDGMIIERWCFVQNVVIAVEG